MSERIWAAYSKASTRNPFGREMIGFCGWHDNATSALARAIERYPDHDPEDLEVNSA